LFAKDLSEITGMAWPPHEIVLEKNATPECAKLRRYSPLERESIRLEIDKMLTYGIIQPSISSWSSPIVLVSKPDGTIRFCVNYKKLNNLTIKDKFPLPRIDDSLDSLAGKAIYSTLDCFSGYWQVPLHPNSQHLTSFISPFGSFQFTVLPFGLTNAPSLFSRIMQTILAPFLFQFVIVYIDDICVFSNSTDEHRHHLEMVFQKLEAFSVKLKFKKCSFYRTSFKYLGHIVNFSGIKPDPDKLLVISEFQRPSNPKTVRSFVGLVSYFRKFLPDITRLLEPIQNSIKTKNFTWDNYAEQAFLQCKTLLTTDLSLKFPDFTRPFTLATDASSFAAGATLEQDHGVVSYFSKKFTGSELNYSTYEKELFAIILALKKFGHYLRSTQFTIYTDNSA
jgi:hypothetical protein